MTIGKKIPDFKLNTSENTPFILRENCKDKSCILLFLHNSIKPLDLTMLNAFKAEYAEFESKGIEIIVICRADKEKLQLCKTTHQFPFTFLSDWYGEVADAYKKSIQKIHFTYRTSIFVDKNHKVIAAYPVPEKGVKQGDITSEEDILKNVNLFKSLLS